MTTDQAILAARAKRLATPLVEEAASGGGSAIVVEIDSQQYAFPLADVRRASMVGGVTELPHVPPIVLGLGVADGEVLAVFDGRIWAGGSRGPRADRTPVLILGAANAPLALAVDRFVGLLALPPAVTPTLGSRQQVTDDGIFIVAVAALLQDPQFSLGTVSESTVDDHH
ncbi:MAG: chemotaxis protein CheW [Deltaproteobacteria bacterium]